jgi:hypothetical protein
MKNQQQLFVYDYMHETEPNPFNVQERVWKGCVILRITTFSGSVRLNGIRSVDRGRGNAGMALQWLCDLAMKYNVTLTLYVRPFGDQRPRLSVWQLYSWYKRYGFVPNPNYTSKREMILKGKQDESHN